MPTLTIPSRQRKTIIWDRLKNQSIILGRDTTLLLILVLTTGDTEKKCINIDLKGDNAACDIVGFMKGTRDEQFVFETTTTHRGVSTRGHVYLKSIMYDHSSTHYKGLMKITKSGTRSDAHMTHDSLLLSPDAKTWTHPALEIEADDIKAGHCATVGHIDEDALFYLRSRGLSDDEARNLLVEGFFEEGLMRIPDMKVREMVRAKLMK